MFSERSTLLASYSTVVFEMSKFQIIFIYRLYLHKYINEPVSYSLTVLFDNILKIIV